MEYDRDISPSTRFAEGLFNGVKLVVCHSFTYAIYMAKERALANNTTFKWEYCTHMCKATIFYPVLLGTTYGMRQLVLMNKDLILSKMHSIHPIFRRSRSLTDICLYFMIFSPLGIACNYFTSGRVLRGSFSLTLMIALIMRAVEGGGKGSRALAIE